MTNDANNGEAAHPTKGTHRVVTRITERLFNVPVMQNTIRSIYVEHMVEALLGDGWRLTSGDWAGWDLEGPGDARLEVKQSAARQTWTARPGRRANPSFDIKVRKGHWKDGKDWVAEPGRHAHLYVFAWHPVEDGSCDQRDAEQWRFFVVPTTDLPKQNSISLVPLARLAQPTRATDLAARVAEVVRGSGA